MRNIITVKQGRTAWFQESFAKVSQPLFLLSVVSMWGLLIISTIDNLLRLIFVGNRLKYHIVLAFLSVVCGLLLFGSAVLILGPVTLTITITWLDIWFNLNTDETAR